MNTSDLLQRKGTPKEILLFFVEKGLSLSPYCVLTTAMCLLRSSHVVLLRFYGVLVGDSLCSYDAFTVLIMCALRCKDSRRLFCTRDAGVARCHSQRQCHFWRMSSLFEAVLTRQLSLAAVNHICFIHQAKIGCKNLKVHLRIASKN